MKVGLTNTEFSIEMLMKMFMKVGLTHRFLHSDVYVNAMKVGLTNADFNIEMLMKMLMKLCLTKADFSIEMLMQMLMQTGFHQLASSCKYFFFIILTVGYRYR